MQFKLARFGRKATTFDRLISADDFLWLPFTFADYGRKTMIKNLIPFRFALAEKVRVCDPLLTILFLPSNQTSNTISVSLSIDRRRFWRINAGDEKIPLIFRKLIRWPPKTLAQLWMIFSVLICCAPAHFPHFKQVQVWKISTNSELRSMRFSKCLPGELSCETVCLSAKHWQFTEQISQSQCVLHSC